MRAARFDSASRKLVVTDVPTPEPGPGDVLVRVAACGICLSDVHLIDGSLPAVLPEVTPGHEAAGTIEAIGSAVPGWEIGQRVVLAGGRPDLTCRNCRRGLPEECLGFQLMGFAFDGAWAEYVVVPWLAAAELPDTVPFEQGAIIADAVATPYAGLTDTGRLRAGESVGLWGIGGLGVHAVQTARLVGASPIIAVDPLPEARARALALGADHALDPAAGDTAAEIWRLTGGEGLDLAVDLVGANAVLAQAATCVGRGGRVVMVGLSMDPVQLGPGLLFGLQRHELLGHLGYSKEHLSVLTRLVESGRLDLSGSVSDVIGLEDVPAGVERLATKDGNPIRIVVRP